MSRTAVTFRAVAAFWAVSAAISACSLTVDTDSLDQGDSGLDCAAQEKVCPDPAFPGRGMCVSVTNPTYGCTGNQCLSCALPNAVARCTNAGKCAIATCEGTHEDCDGDDENGCERDLASDEANCGTCDNRCSVKDGAATCAGGTCKVTFCVAPLADCDRKYSTGCETNLDESQDNCGECGQACAATCSEGTCL